MSLMSFQVLVAPSIMTKSSMSAHSSSRFLIRFKPLCLIPIPLVREQAKKGPRSKQAIKEEEKKKQSERKTYLAFNKLKYNVHAIPQVLWKGTLYWIGMSLKLIPWMAGQIFQLARMAET